MSRISNIKLIQKAVGVEQDGKLGPVTRSALNEFLSEGNKSPAGGVSGKASSFADTKDVAAFRRCKAQGKSDQQCFKLGDNGIGCYGDDTTNEAIPYVAIRPDDMISLWGDIQDAKHKEVAVHIMGQSHICIVGDRMPWAKNVKNGAVIDLAPGAQKLFGLSAPFIVDCTWHKA